MKSKTMFTYFAKKNTITSLITSYSYFTIIQNLSMLWLTYVLSVGIQQEGKRLQKSFQHLKKDNSNDKVSLYSCILCVYTYIANFSSNKMRGE
jgi:hypothetical protein